MNISDEATRRLSQWAQLVQEHPRRLAAIVGTCLLVGGSGAFAVASLGPDPSDLPVQIVLQDIEPLTAQQPLEALEALQFHTFRLYRTDTDFLQAMAQQSAKDTIEYSI